MHDSHNEGDASKYKTQVRFSPEPRMSMNNVHPTASKGKFPKTRNTPSEENKPETPMEESPHMELWSSMKKGKARKNVNVSHMHSIAMETPQSSLSSSHS
jgi:hypothetical protein